MKFFWSLFLSSAIATAQTVCNVTNLVSNGDFESGYTDIGSDYYSCNLGCDVGVLWEGQYAVVSDASTIHYAFTGFGNGGTGKFMNVNGSGSPNTIVWTQTVINVKPNTNYRFTTYVNTLYDTWGDINSTAFLQFSINGSTIGPIFNSPLGLNQWDKFYTVWNSGPNSTANITIVNQNSQYGGNDFGLDDISFIEECAFLPLTILNFDCKNTNNKNEISWICNSTDEYEYVLEKSSNSISFTEIYKNNKSTDLFIDESLADNESAFYRLSVYSKKNKSFISSKTILSKPNFESEINVTAENSNILIHSNFEPIKKITFWSINGDILFSKDCTNEAYNCVISQQAIGNKFTICSVETESNTIIKKIGF